jgi:hypothetical protein
MIISNDTDHKDQSSQDNVFESEWISDQTLYISKDNSSGRNKTKMTGYVVVVQLHVTIKHNVGRLVHQGQPLMVTDPNIHSLIQHKTRSSSKKAYK